MTTQNKVDKPITAEIGETIQQALQKEMADDVAKGIAHQFRYIPAPVQPNIKDYKHDSNLSLVSDKNVRAVDSPDTQASIEKPKDQLEIKTDEGVYTEVDQKTRHFQAQPLPMTEVRRPVFPDRAAMIDSGEFPKHSLFLGFNDVKPKTTCRSRLRFQYVDIVDDGIWYVDNGDDLIIRDFSDYFQFLVNSRELVTKIVQYYDGFLVEFDDEIYPSYEIRMPKTSDMGFNMLDTITKVLKMPKDVVNDMIHNVKRVCGTNPYLEYENTGKSYSVFCLPYEAKIQQQFSDMNFNMNASVNEFIQFWNHAQIGSRLLPPEMDTFYQPKYDFFPFQMTNKALSALIDTRGFPKFLFDKVHSLIASNFTLGISRADKLSEEMASMMEIRSTVISGIPRMIQNLSSGNPSNAIAMIAAVTLMSKYIRIDMEIGTQFDALTFVTTFIGPLIFPSFVLSFDTKRRWLNYLAVHLVLAFDPLFASNNGITESSISENVDHSSMIMAGSRLIPSAIKAYIPKINEGWSEGVRKMASKAEPFPPYFNKFANERDVYFPYVAGKRVQYDSVDPTERFSKYISAARALMESGPKKYWDNRIDLSLAVKKVISSVTTYVRKYMRMVSSIDEIVKKFARLSCVFPDHMNEPDLRQLHIVKMPLIDACATLFVGQWDNISENTVPPQILNMGWRFEEFCELFIFHADQFFKIRKEMPNYLKPKDVYQKALDLCPNVPYIKQFFMDAMKNLDSDYIAYPHDRDPIQYVSPVIWEKYRTAERVVQLFPQHFGFSTSVINTNTPKVDIRDKHTIYYQWFVDDDEKIEDVNLKRLHNLIYELNWDKLIEEVGSGKLNIRWQLPVKFKTDFSITSLEVNNPDPIKISIPQDGKLPIYNLSSVTVPYILGDIRRNLRGLPFNYKPPKWFPANTNVLAENFHETYLSYFQRLNTRNKRTKLITPDMLSESFQG